MAYSGDRKPHERAAKTGHIPILQDQSLVQMLRNMITEGPENAPPGDTRPGLAWEPFKSEAVPLRRVVAVDGSYAPVTAEGCSIAFIKVVSIEFLIEEMEKLNTSVPDPFQLSALLSRGAVVHTAALPVRICNAAPGQMAELLNRTVFETLRTSMDGQLLQTFRWLTHRLWSPVPTRAPSFTCPYCGTCVVGFTHDETERPCANPKCTKTLYITDTAEWDRDLCEDGNPEKAANKYMLFAEMLMLFTKVRLAMEHKDGDLHDTLFTADGALAMNERFCRFVPSIRDLIGHLSDTGAELHLCSIEKSGAVNRKVLNSARSLNGSGVAYAVLTRDYIGRHIKSQRDRKNIYGKRENCGEKVGVHIHNKATLLLNIPTQDPKINPAVRKEDLFGIERILATIPLLVTARYDNAVIQTTMANAIASIAVSPARGILARFVSDIALVKDPPADVSKSSI